jgi:rRNA pseudouridine-1189 N-methylase Emg1 (Nep1/Mra1 family)
MATKAVQEVIHYPRLDTVIMVEESIRKAKNYPTKAELIRHLPKKVMYQTLLLILDYLQKSNKIYIDSKDGRIIWIWNPKGVEDIMKKNLVVR